jgi:iron-sulfur cluster repair protein YtfE (RIC family)
MPRHHPSDDTMGSSAVASSERWRRQQHPGVRPRQRVGKSAGLPPLRGGDDHLVDGGAPVDLVDVDSDDVATERGDDGRNPGERTRTVGELDAKAVGGGHVGIVATGRFDGISSDRPGRERSASNWSATRRQAGSRRVALMRTPDLGMFLLVHRALRRDAHAVVAAARGLDAQAAADAAALLDAYTVFESMLRHHDSTEDELVWPALTERRPSCASELDALATEHEVVERWLDEVRTALTALAAADSVDRAAIAVDLVVAATALAHALDAHLAHEERIAVPLVLSTLDADDWAAIDDGPRAHLAPEEAA